MLIIHRNQPPIHPISLLNAHAEPVRSIEVQITFRDSAKSMTPISPSRSWRRSTSEKMKDFRQKFECVSGLQRSKSNGTDGYKIKLAL